MVSTHSVTNGTLGGSCFVSPCRIETACPHTASLLPRRPCPSLWLPSVCTSASCSCFPAGFCPLPMPQFWCARCVRATHPLIACCSEELSLLCPSLLWSGCAVEGTLLPAPLAAGTGVSGFPKASLSSASPTPSSCLWFNSALLFSFSFPTP